MITLGGKTLEQLGLILQPEHSHPVLPETVDRTLTIPGRHGVVDYGADMGPRLFDLPLAFPKELTQTQLQNRIRALALHLTNDQGRPRDLELRFDYEPEKWYKVRYSGSLPIQRLLSLGFFTLPLVSFDPYAYGDKQEIEQLAEVSPMAIETESLGYVETPPIITLVNEGLNTINGFTIRYFLEKS